MINILESNNLFKLEFFVREMYKAKYEYKTEFDSNGKRVGRSSLDAKFNFWNEVTPKNRFAVKNRIKKFEKTDYFDFTSYAPFIIFRGLHLRMNLFISGEGCVNFGNITDLEGINHYILTGEKPKKE